MVLLALADQHHSQSRVVCTVTPVCAAGSPHQWQQSQEASACESSWEADPQLEALQAEKEN